MSNGLGRQDKRPDRVATVKLDLQIQASFLGFYSSASCDMNFR